MTWAKILSNGVELIHQLTKAEGLQGTVTYRAWLADDDGYGSPKYEEPVEMPALIDQTTKSRRTDKGEFVSTRAAVTFLQVLQPNGAPNRHEPIDTRDVIVLPDGTTGQVYISGGPVNGETGQTFLNEVLIGE